MKKKTGISTAMLSAALALTLAVGGCGSNKSAAPAAPAEPAPASEAPAEEAPEAPVEEVPEEIPESEMAEEDVSLDDEEALAGESLAVWLGGAEEETADMEEYEESIEYVDGYRYDYISGDGILTVINTGWLGVPGDGSPEDSAAEIAAWVLGEDETCADVSVESNDEYSANTTYPVYIVSFTTGENEDTRSWKVFTVATDTCGLAFGVSAPIDIEEDMIAFTDRVFPKLRVEDRDLEASFPGISGLDLFDYFECSIEDVASAFPDLEYDDSYKTNTESSTTFSEPTDGMETLSDGLALAGPFFSVDNEGTVVGIYYGGKNQTICGLCGGMDMKEAGEIAKGHGFEFSRLDVAHGTANYVAVYNNGEMELAISSDAEGDTGKLEESDITGNVDSVSLYLPDKI